MPTFILLILLVTCLGSGHAVAQKVVISSGDYPPWSGKQLPDGGFVNHLITEALSRAGYQAEIRYMPWRRAYLEAKEGRVAASSFWFKNPKHLKAFLLSDKVMEEILVLLRPGPSGPEQWEGWGQLTGELVGYTKGFTYPDSFWEAGKKGLVDLRPERSDRVNLKKLDAGRIDYFLVGEITARQLSRDMFGEPLNERFSQVSPPVQITTGHLAFSRKAPNARSLLKAFNQALAQLHEEGWVRRHEERLRAGLYDLPDQRVGTAD